MTYSVVYTPEAEAGLDRLPPIVASKLMDEIDRLSCDDPYELLEPWYMLFRPVPWYFPARLEDEQGKIYAIKVGIEVDQQARKVWIIYIGFHPPFDD